MKRILTLSTLLATALITSATFGAIASTHASSTADGNPIPLAANQVKTIRHKVHTDNCEQKRKEIHNRCLYHHKMGRNFCAKQDSKNAAVCADLRRKTEEYKAEQQQKAEQQKATDSRFTECITQSGCDQKENKTAIKACYDSCHSSGN